MFNRVVEYVTGPTFAGRVDAVIAQTGWRPSSRPGGAVIFQLTYRRREHEFVLEAVGERMKVLACSNARFALRQFPPGLEKILVERNRELEKFDWELFHGSQSTWAVLVTYARLAAVDGELMRAVASAMLAEVALLDDGLRERGWL